MSEPQNPASARMTQAQEECVARTGNVLVVAGAGTGKTRTLVERVIRRLIIGRGSIQNLLVVTFTEAAAAELRSRIRDSLEKHLSTHPSDIHIREQAGLIESSYIGTLHAFCLKLIRQHFAELRVDPDFRVMSEAQRASCLSDAFDRLLRGKNSVSLARIQNLLQLHARGNIRQLRDLLEQIHEFTQALPDPEGWFERQVIRLKNGPDYWDHLFHREISNWAEKSMQFFADQHRLQSALSRIPGCPRTQLRSPLEHLISEARSLAEATKSDAAKRVAHEAEFFVSLCPQPGEPDPLAEDFQQVLDPTEALLDLARDFSVEFRAVKKELVLADFHDLEQLALDLLWNRRQKVPTEHALAWRRRLDLVLIDEYQDINAAQDTLLRALGREGPEANRFLVGDVKQSIYRFRLANPSIFLDYSRDWVNSPDSRVVPLNENFRSHESLLLFINLLFSDLMREESCGINYGVDAALKFGDVAGRGHLRTIHEPGPRTELHLRLTGKTGSSGDEGSPSQVISDVKGEAWLVANRLLRLKADGELLWSGGEKGPVRWSDIVILLRSPADKAEIWSRVFQEAAVPLATSQPSLFGSPPVIDLVNLIRLLDNPLQDIPLLGVLRSPLAGLGAETLAEIRIASRNTPFWTALNQFHRLESRKSDWEKVDRFLANYRRWRRHARMDSVANFLEQIVAETRLAENASVDAGGNSPVERLLALAADFDKTEAGGLFRFLKRLEAQEELGNEREPPADNQRDVVRLMSIHQSKGLEFPVVVLAGLGKAFNLQDAQERILIDEDLGICLPSVHGSCVYPNLPSWIVRRKRMQEIIAEELRLLYVATTRASDRLILAGSANFKTAGRWAGISAQGPSEIQRFKPRNCLDWIGPWGLLRAGQGSWNQSGGNDLFTWTIHTQNKTSDASSEVPPFPASPPAFEGLDDAALTDLIKRIGWKYRFEADTGTPAKASVSNLRRLHEEASEADEVRWIPRPRVEVERTDPPALTSLALGTAHHLFLERVSLEEPGNLSVLKQDLERIIGEGILSQAEAAGIDLEGIAAFWSTAEGRAILTHRDRLWRELAFTSRFSRAELQSLLPVLAVGAEEDFVVVQGVVDLAVILDKEIWLLDFKTDQFKKEELDARTTGYRTQLGLYRNALERIYKRPVTKTWLHFLTLRRTVLIPASGSPAGC